MARQFLAWTRRARRQPNPQPRATEEGLPPVEQLESRLCLGSTTAAMLQDAFSAHESSPQVAAEEMHVRRADAFTPSSVHERAPQQAASPPSDLQFVAASTRHHEDASLTDRTNDPAKSILSRSLPSSGLAANLNASNAAVGDAANSAEHSAQALDNESVAPGINDHTSDSTPTAPSASNASKPWTPERLEALGLKLQNGDAIAVADTAAAAAQFHAMSSMASMPAAEPQAMHGPPPPGPAAIPTSALLTAAEVELLLERGAAASASNDAIIAVVDRSGRILGVRVESDALAQIPDDPTLVFAIDGAVAKARTAAMFSNGDPSNGTLAPLTSRTVRFISQSTVTEREVDSNPNVDGGSAAAALASTERGPGFVAPIGVGGHFPPDIPFTPLVDLFGIEHTNRDSNLHPGPDGVKGTADDIALRTTTDMTGREFGRFNVDPAFVPAGQELIAPESYGHAQNSNRLPDAQSRGIATLPGGIPLFRDTNGDGAGDALVGGIGVFFPGADGYASFEQGFVPGIGQSTFERTNAPRVLEAEYIAYAAAGGSLIAHQMGIAGAKIGPINGVAPVTGLDVPFGRLDLVGVQLEVFGPIAGPLGLEHLLRTGGQLGLGSPTSGADQPLLFSTDGFHRDGEAVPEGFLVAPHDSSIAGGITAAEVDQIIQQSIAAAEEIRAAVRLPLSSRTRMVFAVTDTNGEVLGLYRMQDATTFSLDVAVAKARNVAYYADAAALQPEDYVPVRDADDNVLPPGTAFTNRTFRFIAQPRFPSGIDGTDPPPFSVLNDDSLDNLTAENLATPAAVSEIVSVLGYDAFFPNTNFRDPGDAGVVAAGGPDQSVANQNGVVFFPGSTPLYRNGVLIGGFGVSGDGVDQDDVVTFLGSDGFRAEGNALRADQTFLDDKRLPYQKFLRNPVG